MILSVSFWAAIRQLQTIVMYFYGRGLGRIRHSSGTHHVVKLFEISEMLVQSTSLSLKSSLELFEKKSSMFVSLI